MAAAEVTGGTNIYDSVSRFLEMIILITSLVPVGENKVHISLM